MLHLHVHTMSFAEQHKKLTIDFLKNIRWPNILILFKWKLKRCSNISWLLDETSPTISVSQDILADLKAHYDGIPRLRLCVTTNNTNTGDSGKGCMEMLVRNAMSRFVHTFEIKFPFATFLWVNINHNVREVETWIVLGVNRWTMYRVVIWTARLVQMRVWLTRTSGTCDVLTSRTTIVTKLRSILCVSFVVYLWFWILYKGVANYAKNTVICLILADIFFFVEPYTSTACFRLLLMFSLTFSMW